MSDFTCDNSERQDTIEKLLKAIAEDKEVDAIIVFGYSIKNGTRCAIAKNDNFLANIPQFCDWYVLMETVNKEMAILRMRQEADEKISRFKELVKQQLEADKED